MGGLLLVAHPEPGEPTSKVSLAGDLAAGQVVD